MNLNISIPNSISEEAKKVARELDISLDELMIAALSIYLASLRGEPLTALLNRVYKGEDSSLDPFWVAVQSASIEKTSW